MFEFSIARKYLIPKKKQLSVSLIALMSVGVISLVVWLLLVFLSVTVGIEKGWLGKLTSLNGPLRITPTEAYYNSYYYQIDALSSASDYASKTIGQKLDASLSDPYAPEVDSEIPWSLSQPDRDEKGSLRDPVKRAFEVLSQLQGKVPTLAYQDYEISGALMRLEMLRSGSPLITSREDASQSYLSQVSYLASFSDQSPYLSSLVSKPTMRDLNHLFYLANQKIERSHPEAPFSTSTPTSSVLKERLHALLDNLSIKELKTSLSHWKVPPSLLPESASFFAIGYARGEGFTHFILPENRENSSDNPSLVFGTLTKKGDNLLFKPEQGDLRTLPLAVPMILERGLHFKASLAEKSLESVAQLKDLRFNVSGSLQGIPLKGEISWEGLEIASAEVKAQFEASPAFPPPWPYHFAKQTVLPSTGILLAKSFQDNGVRIGDPGYLSYAASTASSVQEQRVPVYVAGFYDPGIMSVGNKCILVPRDVAHSLFTSASSYMLDRTEANGIQVWFQDLSQAKVIKQSLQTAFADAGIAAYWKISTFDEYDFARDLLQQFQSDKYLFTLVGIIILAVACCNIISLLVLLVNDKKREIGILQAMGASSWSIGAIFGSCGMAMGILGSLIGTGAAVLTLSNIDKVVKLLSWVQGHDAFNAAFYGNSLPNQLSSDALIFILIATPLLSLAAGLVPAIKACRLRPSAILRSE